MNDHLRLVEGGGDGPSPDLESVDLSELAYCLDSRDLEGYLDPATGQIYQSFGDELIGPDDEPVDLDEVDWVRIYPVNSRDAYSDMEVFADAVADPLVARRLDAALRGRGAFRRFRDAVYDQRVEVITAWNDYRNVRSETRALKWLYDNDLADETAVRAAMAERDAAAERALEVVRGLGAETCSTDDVVARWPDLVARIDAGESVVVTRDGRKWAVIEAWSGE